MLRVQHAHKRKVEKYVPHNFGKSILFGINSLYIFMCIWRDLPQFYMFPCSHGNISFARAPLIFYVPMFPWKYFFSMKREKNKEIKKRVHEA
jgi:hypothetical protein